MTPILLKTIYLIISLFQLFVELAFFSFILFTIILKPVLLIIILFYSADWYFSGKLSFFTFLLLKLS